MPAWCRHRISCSSAGSRTRARRSTPDWHELLAATLVTVLLAVPVLVAAAFVEVYVSPGLLRGLAG
jgi:uncharacterized membrane protein SpoIIM required for sporulation